MNRVLKDALVLTVITLIAGCLLGGVYHITREPIAKANEEAKQEAYRAVFKDAQNFQDVEGFSEEDADQWLSENGYADNTIEQVVSACDANGQALGDVLTVTSSAGYGGEIKLSVGIRSDGTVCGYEVLTINETAGLGMKAKEDAFASQFRDKNVKAFSVTKGESTSQEEIEAISGATITSKAVTGAVNAAISYFGQVLTQGGAGNE